MNTMPPSASYLLIDSALLAPAALLPVAAGFRPDWLAIVYDEAAASVSPLVIDIQAAWDNGATGAMLTLLNAVQPQLHVSIIDTALSHLALVEHLRRFIMIRTETGNGLTLRFADCLGLPVLATTFSAEQWAAFTLPVVRWCIHGRDGALHDLPLPDHQKMPVPTPLVLTDGQIAAMSEATAPDAMIADIREMRHDLNMPGSGVEHYKWASEARQIWRTAGNVDLLVLRWLTAAALDTHGAILGQSQVQSLLRLGDPTAIRFGLDKVAAQSAETSQRSSSHADRGTR